MATYVVGKPKGLLVVGNIDLDSRPVVKNADGSISTVRSITVGFDDGTVVLPTVSDDGRILSEKDAIQLYRATGRHLGIFDTLSNAEAYSQSLHLAQEQQYVKTTTGQVTSGQVTYEQYLTLPVEEQVRRMMLAIGALESGGGIISKIDYNALNKNSGASGAYQMLDATWKEYARRTGLSNVPAKAMFADPEDQDEVFNFILTSWRSRMSADKFVNYAPISWFGGEGTGSKFLKGTLSLNEKAPGFNNGLTWGAYMNIVQKILFGKQSFELNMMLEPYKWKKLPMCLNYVDVQDVAKLEEVLFVPDAFKSPNGRFGTLLQLYVADFQKKAGLPVTGCFGESEANYYMKTLVSDEFVGPVLSTGPAAPGKFTKPQAGLPAGSQKLWVAANAQFGKYLSAIFGWGDDAHKLTKSCHNTGNALDFMTSNAQVHSLIVGWLLANRQQFGISLIISRGVKWSAKTGWQPAPYKGQSGHFDHVHASCNSCPG